MSDAARVLPDDLPRLPSLGTIEKYRLAIWRMDRGLCPECASPEKDEDGVCVPCKEVL